MENTSQSLVTLAPHPAAILFDMDGLLVASERASYAVWQEVCAQHGYVMTADLFAKTVGKTMPVCNAILREGLGAEFPAEDLRKLKNEIFDRRIAESGLPPMPGAQAMLEFLDCVGMPFAVATTTRRAAALHRLQHAGLGTHVRELVGGDEVAHAKPAPDLYLEAARRLGVDPKSCVVAEDSETGAEAAWSAGMRVVLIPDFGGVSEEATQRAIAVMASLDEFRLAVERSLRDAKVLEAAPHES